MSAISRGLAAALCLTLVCACDGKSSKAKRPEAEPEDTGAAAPSPQAEPEAESPEAESPEAKPEAKPELSEPMREHFADAEALEQAVMTGDLEAARTRGRALIEKLPLQELPAGWEPHVERMRTAAIGVVETRDLVDAAMATGRVLGACGACHATVGGGPKPANAAPAMPEGEDAEQRMARHRWAAQRLREGLITPSDERWSLGAGAVSVAPPAPIPIDNAERLNPEVLELREHIYEIGAVAAKTEGLDARAEVYGDYLTTCAGCHLH